MNPATIFLSYAREDAPAARRLGEALRAAGHEVWFDEDELRGGDAWDAKIRRQIRECTLFVPIVSARTQARPEGYFRREWKLAVERTHDMAAGIAFLVPVAIDETREADALVPEEFLRVQWTRLPGAQASPSFLAQMQRLVTSPRSRPATAPAPVPGAGAQSRPTPEPPTAVPAIPAPASVVASLPRRRRAPLVLLAALGACVLAAALLWILRPGARTSSSPARGSADVTSVSAPKAAADKSIAVLPLANLSDNKDNAFFTDGVHEDILTNLALIRDLRVVSRTTVMRYREVQKSAQEIGRELGVAYILEGSVRRVGNRVRVTGQLINTRNDEHVWAKSYDRDLTDIFAIQAALAQEIAGALQAALSPETRQQLARRPTENPAAYDLYLRGRDARSRLDNATRESLKESERLFGAAVERDPGFAQAWGELAVVHALHAFHELDVSPGRLARADAAAAEARHLAPDSPEVIRLEGTYAFYAYRNYDRATAAYRTIIDRQPNDATAHASLALVLQRQGRWKESTEALRRAVELDPANLSTLRELAQGYGLIRRWPEAVATQRRLLTLVPGNREAEFAAADFEFLGTGRLDALRAFVASLSTAERVAPVGLTARRRLARLSDDYEAFCELGIAESAATDSSLPLRALEETAIMHAIHGDAKRANEVATIILRETERALAEATGPVYRNRLARSLALAVLGRTDEAARGIDDAVAILPESRDAIAAGSVKLYRVIVFALGDRREDAVREARSLLLVPQFNPVHVLGAFPSLRRKLGGYGPWEALLADPKSNAPLY